MNEAERHLISGLFDRIRGVETARRDPEAEVFISDKVAEQPHAPYAMAQTLVVQDRSLQAAQARIAELERELDAARAEAEPPAPSSPSPYASPWGPRAQESMARAGGGGFDPAAGERMSPPFGAPQTDRGYPQQPGYGAPPRYEQPSQGGGFLSGALQTAAGVAAGALVFQGVRSLFGGDETKAAGADAAAKTGGGEAGAGSDAGSIGDWYSNAWGGSGDKQAAAAPANAYGDGGNDADRNDADQGDAGGFFDLGGGDDDNWT